MAPRSRSPTRLRSAAHVICLIWLGGSSILRVGEQTRPLATVVVRRAGGDWLSAVSPEQYALALTGQRVNRDWKVHCPLHDD